jgi:L-glutamine-phosphate cytidylyltransferase
MRYIILAAGVGERLHPLTTINPKCLYKLDENSTVIKRTIDLINSYDSNAEIIVVVGYMFDMFAQELDGVKFIRNPFYKITNSIASLWFAKEYLYGDFVILNGDVVMNHALM